MFALLIKYLLLLLTTPTDFKQNLDMVYNPFTQQWNVTENDLLEGVAALSLT